MSGSSSSGKSTLSRAVLAALPVDAVLIEADTAFPTVNNWPKDGSMPSPVVVFHQSVAAWWRAGTNVILDGSLPYGNDELRQRCLDQLPADRTFSVAVSCSVEELRRREAARSEARQAGWAARQAVDINDGLDPIVSIDTTTDATEDHVKLVFEAMRGRALL